MCCECAVSYRWDSAQECTDPHGDKKDPVPTRFPAHIGACNPYHPMRPHSRTVLQRRLRGAIRQLALILGGEYLGCRDV
jgi:hypothetical protein